MFPEIAIEFKTKYSFHREICLKGEGRQTVFTLIRLLLYEQSDVGLHCLQWPISPKGSSW